MRSITVALLSFSVLHSVAQYNGPESVEYDAVGDRYFVSNTGSGVIAARDQAGVVTTFATVSPAPYGLELKGDTLFACSGGGVKGYLTSTGAQVFNRSLGATFCNGITTDGRYLYVTDFSGARIYKVDPDNNSHTTLVANTAGTPNGIVWDAAGQRLVVVFWGNNAVIKAFDRDSGAATTLVAGTGLTNIDGITIDCLGNFLIASWSPDRITRYDPTFTAPAVDLMVPGLNNPADIDFDAVNNRVCIPNSGNNTVTVFDVSCTTAIPERTTQTLKAFPNPTSGLLRFEPSLKRAEPYILLDGRGLLIGGGTINAYAQLDISNLAAGRYTILFTRTGERVAVVRE